MNKLMFTSRPPVKLEVDEQKRTDVLHASAVAMAKKMYNQQQKMIESQKAHADTAPRGNLKYPVALVMTRNQLNLLLYKMQPTSRLRLVLPKYNKRTPMKVTSKTITDETTI